MFKFYEIVGKDKIAEIAKKVAKNTYQKEKGASSLPEKLTAEEVEFFVNKMKALKRKN